jgi:hypothetical protein
VLSTSHGWGELWDSLAQGGRRRAGIGLVGGNAAYLFSRERGTRLHRTIAHGPEAGRPTSAPVLAAASLQPYHNVDARKHYCKEIGCTDRSNLNTAFKWNTRPSAGKPGVRGIFQRPAGKTLYDMINPGLPVFVLRPQRPCVHRCQPLAGEIHTFWRLRIQVGRDECKVRQFRVLSTFMWHFRSTHVLWGITRAIPV